MAITYVEQNNAFPNYVSSQTLSLSDAVSPTTHAIIAIYQGGDYVGAPPTGLQVTDNVNTGTYTQAFYFENYPTQDQFLWVGYMKCNGTGTPTVTFSVNNTTSVYGPVIVIHLSGFVQGIAPVSADTAVGYSTSSSNPSLSGFTNSQANEFLVANMYTGGTPTLGTPSPANWINIVSGTGAEVDYWIEATSGNSITYSNTITPMRGWLAGIVGFYDAPTTLPLAIRQTCVGYSGATSVASQSATFAEATLAGSTIYVVSTCNIAGSNMLCSDAVNGGYQQLDSINDMGPANTAVNSFVFQNAASLSASQAITVSPVVSVKYVGLVAFEIEGTPVNSLVGHASILQVLATTAANSIATPTVQAGIGSALAISVSMNTLQNNKPSAPVVGSGFSAAPSPGNAFWPFSSYNTATAEYKSLTNAGVTATFTPPGATSDDYATVVAIFGTPFSATFYPLETNEYF